MSQISPRARAERDGRSDPLADEIADEREARLRGRRALEQLCYQRSNPPPPVLWSCFTIWGWSDDSLKDAFAEALIQAMPGTQMVTAT